MSVYGQQACCTRTEVGVKWPTPSTFRSQVLAGYGTGTNKPKMLAIDPLQVVPMATTGVQDRFNRNQALRNRSQTANQTIARLHQATGVRVTSQMIRNRLHAAHLPGRWLRVVPTLTSLHLVYRREWCRVR